MLAIIKALFGREAISLWYANQAISKVSYTFGFRSRHLSNTILSPQKLDPIELSFNQWVGVYKTRTPRDAAIMILIELSYFWKKQSAIADDSEKKKIFFLYHSFCIEGAKDLAKTEWRSVKNTDQIIEEIISNKAQ